MFLGKILSKISRFYEQKIYPEINEIRGTTFISRKLSSLALKFTKTDEVRLNGVDLVLDSALIDEDIGQTLIRGNYEQEEFKTVKKHVKPTNSVIELGGGLGYISCIIDSQLSDNSVHKVIEPNPKVLKTLKRNMEINNADFEVIEKAYSPNENRVKLSIGEKFWSSSTYYEKQEDKVEIESTSLEELTRKFSKSNLIGIIDIEGEEYEMIEEEIQILHKNFQKLIIEFHRIEENPKDYKAAIKTLEDNGFLPIEIEENVQVFNRKNKENKK